LTVRIAGNDIFMIRGDTETILVSCKNSEGEPVPFVPGDTIYFTVKRSTRDEKKVLQKVVTEFQDGKAVIEIEHEDTKDLEFQTYVYDVQHTSAGGKVTTIIPPSKFVIEGEVTHE
jgi:hypothetical protein